MKYCLLLILSFSFSLLTHAQTVDSLARQLDSLHRVQQEADNKPVLNTDEEDYTSRTNITPRAYVALLGTDLLQEVTGPFHASKRTWVKVGEFALLEGALVFADKWIQKNTLQFMNHNPNLRSTSQYITNFGDSYQGLVLLAFAAYGVIFKNNKVKTTALLATQSYIASAAMATLVKVAFGRRRPSSFNEGEENNLIFTGPASDSRGSSLPSGHATAAFSAATVFAQEYRDEPLVPIIAYSAATLIGITRLTQNAHWATDVLAGAALGYITGKQVVRNYHRYARLQNAKKKTTWIWNVQYSDGVLMPQLICRF